MIDIPALSLNSITPHLVIILTAIVVVLIDLFLKDVERINLTLMAMVGVVVAFVFARNSVVSYEPVFSGMILRDGISIVLDQLFLVGAGLIILLSHRYCELRNMAYGEYLVLLLCATLGMMVISISADLIMLFVGIELLSLSLYILAGFDKSSLSSGEASLKYFLLGAFSTGFLVYGMAFLFGICRTTNLITIGESIATGGEGTPLLLLGFALILVGLGFKISLVPFHMWAPDVYQGAPTPITAWIATGSKMAGFVALIRIFSLSGSSFAALSETWSQGFWWLAMVTMIIGNTGALMQKDIKRMLAYSSIAHGGYVSMAFVAQNEVGLQALLFYLAAYLFMTIGAFGVVMVVRRNGEECKAISQFAGLARQKPLLAGVMSLFLFSLAGMPCTAGFVGKLWLFGSAIQSHYYALALVGILTTLLSFYYYLRVIVYMYMSEADENTVFDFVPVSATVATGIAAMGVIVFGMYPNLLWQALSAYTSGV